MSADLRTRYLGLDLAGPLVVSACSLGAKVEALVRLEEAGASAVVLPSLFEEQIVHDEMETYRFLEDPSNSFPEALTYFPDIGEAYPGPEGYLRHIEAAKAALTVPVIGSLNGTSDGGWVRFARLIQQAGADALELNVYHVVTDPDVDARAVEDRYAELVASVRGAVTIPLAVKIGPYFSALPNFARRLVAAGADGLVLFNRFLQPDIDVETRGVVPNLVLSTSDELRLPLRWIAILRGQTRASLAATTGVHTFEDVLKLLLAGADATMLASALYKHGPGHIATLLHGLRAWMDQNEYESVRQLKGSVSQANSADPAAFERSNYIKTLATFLGPAIWGRADRPRGA